MRHQNKTVKLGRNSTQRKALQINQITNFLKNGYMTTTLAKAKALRPAVEKVITKARVDSVANRRYVTKYVNDKEVLKKLFTEVSPNYKERPGGYLRIIKLQPRPGDNAPMARVELV